MERLAASVLVVDDDLSLRLLYRVNLELDGFTVREAATLAEADAALATARPDVVLLDVHLEQADTRELLGRLRAEGIPVALVTGSADLADYAGAADALLGKPFEPRTLVETARRLARVGPDA
jgi:DNA-binding response OmpR family regulator